MDITSRDMKASPPRILNHRKHVGYFAFVVRFISIIWFVLMIFFVGEYQSQDIKNFNVLKLAGLMLFLWTAFYLLYKYFLQPKAQSRIQVYSDHFYVSKKVSDAKVFYKEVVSVKKCWNSIYNSGFRIKTKDGKTFNFSTEIERIDYLLDKLIEFNPELLEADTYFNLRVHLISKDHSFARLQDLFTKKYKRISLFHVFGAPAIFASVLYFLQLKEFEILSPVTYFFKVYSGTLFFSVIVWILIMFFANFNFTNKLIDQLSEFNKKTRDLIYEGRVFVFVYPVFLILLASFMYSVSSTKINTLGIYSMSNGKKVYYDSRYNCVGCNYPLNKGDWILTGEHGVAKIVGTRDDRVAMSHKSEKRSGRYVASIEKKNVSDGEFAIKLIESDTTILIKKSEIKGKIFEQIPHFK